MSNPREGSRPQKRAPKTPTRDIEGRELAELKRDFARLSHGRRDTPIEIRKAEQAKAADSAELVALRRRVAELEAELEQATAPSSPSPAPADLGDAPERPSGSNEGA